MKKYLSGVFLILMPLWLVVFLPVEILEGACSNAQANRPSSVKVSMAGASSRKKRTSQDSTQLELPPCPPAGYIPTPPPSEGGHHKVTLSWNASTSSPVGYCVYRSKNQKAIKLKPTCSLCEQMNLMPLSSVSCVDDVVADSTTYYYVVTAINPADKMSSPSNEITVPVPSNKQMSPAPAGSSAPLCRNPSTAR